MRKLCYLETGQPVYLIEECQSGGYLVSAQITVDGVEGDDAPPFWVEDILGKDPVSEQISRLDEVAAKAWEASDALQAERQEFEQAKQDWKNRMAKLIELAPQLDCLEMFLEDRITHVITINGYTKFPSVEEWEAVRGRRDGSSTVTRLLSLYGDKKMAPHWGLSWYGDGSGMTTRMIPCAGEEDVKAKMKEYLLRFNEFRHVEAEDLKVFDTYGVALSPDFRKRVLERAVAQKKASISSLEKEIERKRNDIASTNKRMASLANELIEVTIQLKKLS